MLLEADAKWLLQLAATDGVSIVNPGENKPARVDVLAYTGGLVQLDSLPLPVVFDLSSTRAAPAVTMLYGHDRNNPIGHFDSINVGTDKITVSGPMSIDSEQSQKVKDAAKNGFPWQASVGIHSATVEYLGEGKSASVNGRAFSGPIYIARDNLLREVSILTIGADPNTVVKLSANLGNTSMNFEEWVKSLGFDATTLTPEQKTALQGIYDTMMSAGATDAAKATAKATATALMTACASVRPTGNGSVGNAGNNSSANVTAASTATNDLNAAAIADMRAAHAAERTRIDSINQLATEYQDPRNATGLISAQAIQHGWTIEATELAMLRASRPTGGRVVGGPARLDGVNPQQVLEAAICQSAMMQDSSLQRQFAAPVLQAAHTQYADDLGCSP
jgi:hypothetical protein